jgi:hypothetical protein
MAEPAITQDEHGLKQRAMRRLAIALTVIAAAIVALAVLDRYNSVPKKTAVPLDRPSLHCRLPRKLRLALCCLKPRTHRVKRKGFPRLR